MSATGPQVASPAPCKCCERMLPKIPLRQMLTGTWIYQDGTGRQWVGLLCPDCNSARRNASRTRKPWSHPDRAETMRRRDYKRYTDRCARAGVVPIPMADWQARQV